MRLDVGLPTEIVTAGSDSNVSVCIRLGVEAIQRNCYNETNNNNNNKATPKAGVNSLLYLLLLYGTKQE